MKLTLTTVKKTITSLLKIVVLLTLALNINVIAQENSEIEKRISNLINNKIKLDSLRVIIYEIIQTRDTSYLRKQLDRIISVASKDKNKRNYVYSLTAYSQCNTAKTIPYLNEAYRIAKENNFTDMLPHIIDTKGSVYKGKGMYDSLLVSLMEAKNIYEDNSNLHEFITILHSTADLYYSVKLYDRAEKLYLEIMEKKGNLGEWKFWRNVVVINNLGLIEMERGNYNAALKYFNKSFNIIEKDSTSSRYTIALGYNTLQLTKCYLKMENYKLANHYYKISLQHSLKNNMLNELIALYNIKAELFFNKGKIDSSLVYTQKAYELFREESSSKNRLLPIYKSFYNIFNKLENFEQANNYLYLYANLQDSLNNASQSARYMQILAENDYQKSISKVNLLETKNYFLLIIVVFASLFLLILFAFYLRLRSAHIQLVDKSLEIAGADISPTLIDEKETTKNNGSSDSKIATKEQIELIKSLELLMKTKKPFLKNDISINDVALQLNSNRTYLSRAINISLKKNFVAYVNALRIKEAIRGISSGKYKDMTIEGISTEVGFSNRVSFNSAFKKYTGVLPSYFINEISKRG